MFPDIEIAADGRAHLVYTHDPQENGFTIVDPETGEEIFLPDVSTTAEDGDIHYIRSPGKPYTSWSAPMTLNDDGLVRAQGYPALATSQDHHGKTTLHVLWEDHRRSPEGPSDPDRFGESSDLYYDIFATSRRPGAGWTRNRRVTDKRSISDFLLIGDYFDITTSGGRLVFGIWTDRRHNRSRSSPVASWPGRARSTADRDRGLRMGAQVVEPGGMLALAPLGRNHHQVAAIGHGDHR